MKHLLFSLLLLSSLSFAGELEILSRKSVYIPSKLGKIALATKDNEFSIIKDDQEIPVKYHNTNHLLRHITESGALSQFLNDGSIFVSQDNGGDYILTAKGRVKGGGYYTGKAFGWIVRGIGYGVPAYLAGKMVKDASKNARHSKNFYVREVANASTDYIDSAINVGIPQNILARNIVDKAGITETGIAVANVTLTAQTIGLNYMTVVETAATVAEVGGTAIWFLP